MTKDEIIEMARQAGVDMSLGEHWSFFIEELEAFAKLVAEKAIKEALAQPTSGDYALGYSIGFGEGHSAGKALAQPEQEPVAWLQICLAPLHEGDVIARTTKPTKWNPEWWRFEPLYTTPPQRTWVGLTNEEIYKIHTKQGWNGMITNEIYANFMTFAYAIEAQLKAKNTRG